MQICVVGTGYVGLVVGACLADQGFSVTCADRDADKIDALNHDGSNVDVSYGYCLWKYFCFKAI